ncbi:HEAT repeat domain-containing protein [Myxococcaceae bacterium GXIMD 01537]
MSDERPDALLRSALEKIVYFEARAEQLHGELEESRSDVERLKRELSDAGQREITVRRELAELEVRTGRAVAERDELARLNQALRSERNQLMDKLLDISRIHASGQAPREDVDDDLGIDLASFISQLRSEALGRPGDTGGAPARPMPSPRLGTTPSPVPPSRAVMPSSIVAKVEATAVSVVAVIEEARPALAVAAVAAPSAPTGGEGLSPVAQQARRFLREGRLGVSAEQLAELTGHAGLGLADDTLFGFSVRELSAQDPAARVRAAERLKALAQPSAAPALAAALHAEVEPTAQVALIQAFSALCKEEGASVISPLMASPVAEVRIATLKALLTLSPRDAAPHLAQAMKDPDRSVRRRASLLALGLEGETARRLGEEAIHDSDPEVRGLAALALGAASGESARALLLEALHDEEVRVRKSAAQSLSRILGQDVSSVVSLDEAHRRREVRRLATLPVKPVRATLESLKPPAPRAIPVAGAQGSTSSAPRAAPADLAARAVAASPVAAQGSAPVAPPSGGQGSASAALSSGAQRPASGPVQQRSAPVAAGSASAAQRPAPVAAQHPPAPKRSAASVVAMVASPPGGPAAPQGPARPAPAPRAVVSPVETLCAPMLHDIRCSVRGRSMGELSSGLSAAPELAQEALTLLVARGQVVRRGHKYFAA